MYDICMIYIWQQNIWQKVTKPNKIGQDQKT